MMYYKEIFSKDLDENKINDFKYCLENGKEIQKYKVIIYFQESKNLIEAVNTKYINEILVDKKILVLGFCKNNNEFKVISKEIFEYFLKNNINIIDIKKYFEGVINDR